MKKITGIITALCMLFTMIPITWVSANPDEGDSYVSAYANAPVMNGLTEYGISDFIHILDTYEIETSSSKTKHNLAYFDTDSLSSCHAALEDFDGDGQLEMLLVVSEAANVHIRVFKYGSLRTSCIFERDYYYSGEYHTDKVDITQGDKTYLKITYLHRDWKVEQPTYYNVEEYNDLSNNSSVSLESMVSGNLYKMDEESVSADKYTSEKSKYEGTRQDNIYTAEMDDGNVRTTDTTEFTIDDMYEELFSRKLSFAGELTNISDSTTDDDKLKIQTLISIMPQIYTAVKISALSESELIDYVCHDILSVYPDRIPSVASYTWSAGGMPILYAASDVEQLIYQLTGVKMDLKTHYCDNDNCVVGGKWELSPLSTIDQKAIDMVNNREGVIIGTTEGCGSTYAIINQIYQMNSDTFLIMYTNCGLSVDRYDDTKLLKSVDDLPESPGSQHHTYAIVGRHIYNGQNEYYMIEYGGYDMIDSNNVSQYIKKSAEPSNITIDYKAVNNYENYTDYVEYLKSLLDGTEPNDNAKSDIAEYIEYAAETYAAVDVPVKGKKITLKVNDIEPSITKADEIKAAFDDLLKEKNIQLNRMPEIVIKVNSAGNALKKGVTVIYDSTLAEITDRIDGIKVIYDSDRQSVSAKSDAIKTMVESGANSVKLTANGNAYNIGFLDKDGSETDKGAAQLQFAFKANDEYDTIYYNANGEKTNWSGQINENDNTIEFMTSLSGTYYVEKNEISISDIDSLTDEEKEAVKFMVSRGYFDLTDGAFNPYGSLSRNEFTKILVSIFYALDFDNECTFSDVANDDSYYDYIASSQKNEIVNGYEDNTFRGSRNTTREEVISISARTLSGKKEYSYPENTADYVKFADDEQIAGWENQYGEIALAVREGLIEQGGILAPKANITRLDAAVILYRLFNLLYPTAPAETEVHILSGGISAVQLTVVAGSAVIVIGGIAALIVVLKKRRKNKNITE